MDTGKTKTGIREYLKRHDLIADGAFGTYYGEKYHTQELPELAKVYRDALKIADAYPDSLGARILRESLSIGEPEAILNTEQTLRELQEWLIRKSDPC